MNSDTKQHSLPSLVGDVVTDPKRYIDNLFSDGWKRLKLEKNVVQSGFKKRSGVSITEAVFLLLVWKWLNVTSIGMFCRKSLQAFSQSHKDVMYELLKREDTNWRALHQGVAKQCYSNHDLKQSRVRAFVLDDSIVTRKGKKLEGVSSHFDHVTGRHVMGQQVLTLGLATEDAFLPLDSQIFVSQTKVHGLDGRHIDKRSVAAKRYEEAVTKTKPEMSGQMLKRAQRGGIPADYLLADAWFGTKPMIKTALDLNLKAILRMKKNNTKYRVTTNGKESALTAKELYGRMVRKKWGKVQGMSYRAAPIKVELDISGKAEKLPRWIEIQLLFVKGLNESKDADAGKKDWALFLSTDTELSIRKILEIYALRWGIEVYFKEAKQHLGLLKEQTRTFASHTASIHLCAIRYLMLVDAKLEDGELRVADARANIKDHFETLNLAAKLWLIFRSIISDTLQDCRKDLGISVKQLVECIDDRIQSFIIQSLQLDTNTMRLEYG